MKITNKNTSLDLFTKGAFGNTIKSWKTLKDVIKDKGSDAKITMRYKGLYGGGPCHYNVSILHATALILHYYETGNYDLDKFYFNDTADDSKLLIQGELCKSHRLFELRYSTAPYPMREALRIAEKYTYGVKVIVFLKKHLTPSSYEDLMAIFETYPNSVVEFSCWGYNPGTLKGRNTVVWEVRNY